MEEQTKCERCGTWLSADNPEGLCSSCLIRFGIHGFENEELATPAAEPNLCDLGDYELLDEVARGGMGVVYRARQKSLDRIVAVKLILVGKWASPAQLVRFKAEAAAASRLDHPNIVPIYEISESSGHHFFSMKLIEGGNLAQRISDYGPTASDFFKVARLLAVIARAVHYAHQHGVIHRDLKPTNTLLDRQGQPHITDFGLAKIFDEDGASSVSAAMLGTPSYMAPEQAAGQGARITTAADTYSLGAMLYEILTGRPPFRGSSAVQILQATCEREPESIRKLRPNVPPDLEVICLRCLNKEPSRRYGSAEALAEDLERWAAGEPILARRVSASERVWLWARRKPVTAGLIAALILLALLASVGSAVMVRRIAAARDHAATLAETNRRQLVELNLANGLRLIDAGNRFESLPWLVEALRLDNESSARQRNHRVRLASLLRELPRPDRIFFHDGPAEDAQFDAVESHVAVAAGDRVFLWESDTGELALPALEHFRMRGDGSRRLDGVPVSQLGFSPDGRSLLGVCGDFVQLWNVLTGQRIGEPLRHQARVVHALFVSEGKEVLTASEDGTVTRWSSESGQKLGLPLQVGAAYALAVHPGGHLLATAGIQSGTRLWNLADWKPVGEPLLHGWAVFDVAFSPDGTRVATAGGDNRARLWDSISGKPIGRTFWHKDHVVQVAFSQDSKYLATVSRDHTTKVWFLTDDTREPLTLAHKGPVTRAVFSPDGAWIATASMDNTARVWDVFDGRPITPPLLHNNAVTRVSFTRDGKRLLTTSTDGTARVWNLPAATSTQTLFRDAWWFFNPPNLSPNGRYALITDPVDTALVWDTAAERILSPALRHPKPAFLGSVGDDAQLAVTACHDEQVRLWDVTAGHLVGNPIAVLTRRLTILSPDKRYLVLVDDRGTVQIWDLNTTSKVAEFAGSDKPPRCGAFEPESNRVAIGTDDGAARVFDIHSKQLVAKLNPGAPITAVAFGSISNLLAAGNESGQALVWSLASQKTTASLPHPRAVNALAFSPDNQRLLTASEDGAARLWNIASQKLLLPPLRHSSPLRSVVFSPDGRLAITVDARLDPQMWELDTGQPLTPPRQYHTRMDIHAGSDLADATLAWNWNLPADDRPMEELITEALALSGRKLDHLGGLTLLDPNDFKAAWLTWRSKHP